MRRPSLWSVESLLEYSYRRPRDVLAVWAVILFLASFQWLQLAVDTTIGSALDRSGRAWSAYERSLSLFGGDEFIAILLPPSPEPYSEASLENVLALSETLEENESVRRVDSLSTVPLIRSDEQGSLLINPALTASVASSSWARGRLAEQVRSDRIASRSLVSGDGKVFGVNVVFGDDVDGDRDAVVSEIQAALTAYPGAVMSGVPVVRAEAGALTRSEIIRLVPLTVLVIAVFLLAAFGRLRAVLPALAVGAVGSGLCLSAMAAADVPLSFSTAVLPSVILALSCAYSMHLLAAEARAYGAASVVEELRGVAAPVALSGATTALGFISMATTNVSLIRDLAAFGALGVIVSTLACLTLAPAILSLSPSEGARQSPVPRTIETVVGPAWTARVLRYRSLILAAWVGVLVFCAFGVARLEVSSDVIQWFPEDGGLRKSYAAISERLSGITPVNVVVEPPQGMSAVSPEMLRSVAGLATALEVHPAVGKSLSIADPLAMMHRELGDGDGDSFPTDPSLVAQYLTLLDGVEQIDDVVTPLHDYANILLRLDDNSSEAIRELAEWVRNWWEVHGLPNATARVTGIMFEFARAQDAIAYAGIRGSGIALATVALLVAAYFRDLRFILSALVVNAVPVAVIMGAVGWIGTPLDAATVCVASLAIGIAVDDTIHALSEIAKAAKNESDKEKAVSAALPRVMSPLTLSTVAIGAGFAVLGTSSIALISGLGLTMCAAVGACLLADVTLLPSLLAIDRQRERK